jgi:hypothetical protein
MKNSISDQYNRISVLWKKKLACKWHNHNIQWPLSNR